MAPTCQLCQLSCVSGNQLAANFSTLRSSMRHKISNASALLLYRYQEKVLPYYLLVINMLKTSPPPPNGNIQANELKYLSKNITWDRMLVIGHCLDIRTFGWQLSIDQVFRLKTVRGSWNLPDNSLWIKKVALKPCMNNLYLIKTVHRLGY